MAKSRVEINKMLGRARRRAKNSNKMKDGKKPPSVVGTEAAARENIEKNRVAFNYPDEGFAVKVEHSLLYSMIKEPNIYPRSVLVQHIADEDFSVYMTLNSKRNQEPGASYAQLSALLALAAEHYPPNEENSVMDALVKIILRLVLRYTDEHGLDREAELKELFLPVQQYAEQRNLKAEMRGALGLYAGYTAALITANPLPFFVGLALYTNGASQHEEEMRNVRNMKEETLRRADVETASLLEEIDDV